MTKTFCISGQLFISKRKKGILSGRRTRSVRRYILTSACFEKIDFVSLLFDTAFDLALNIALILRRSAVPVLRKEALARTLGLFSAYGLVFYALCLGPDQMP
jgi:hypothetical protein